MSLKLVPVRLRLRAPLSKKVMRKPLTYFDQFDGSKNYVIRDAAAFEKIPARYRPMYCLYEVTLFSHVPISENGDVFVVLSKFLSQHNSRIMLAPGSTPYGSAKGELLLRRSAAQRLLKAEKLLHGASADRYSFRITDAYRPLVLQRQHFKNVKIELFEKEGLDAEALYDRALECISDPDLMPPHSTGGTLDLTIYDTTTGIDVPMGTLVDEVANHRVWTWSIPTHETEIRKNRSLLYFCMTKAGFVNCPTEWWHYSYGDQEWALRKKKSSTLFTSI